MKNYKFIEYNWVKKGFNSEIDTLDNIKEDYLDNKLTVDEKELIKHPEKWAKYAFKNEMQYYVTFYNKENQPFVCVEFNNIGIDLFFFGI